MIPGVHAEVLLAGAYSVFLAAAAVALELLASHSHSRSQQYRNSGFVYRRQMDLWECPAGRFLVRIATDHERRIVRYRAPAQECNACSLKNNCTDSDEGRLLEARLDYWVESELRRFHRGISLTLLVLATLILFVELIRHAHPREMVLMGALLIPLAIVDSKLIRSLRPKHRN